MGKPAPTNAASILDSTRSFRTSRRGRFLCLDVNHHVEQHLYPQVPFPALPKLHDAVAGLVRAPDPGFFRTNLEVLSIAVRRSLGRNTRAHSIRQAPHMISDGAFVRIASRTT